MALRKKEYSKITLSDLSVDIMSNLEQTDWFQAARCVAFYHALPDEVQTADFIEKWYRKKQLLLPIVEGNDLKLALYTGPESVQKGAFGILEPIEPDKDATNQTAYGNLSGQERLQRQGNLREQTNRWSQANRIDLMIIPGIAFDRQKNRMGRGKGYYDRLLASLTVPKIGLCFGFQLFDEIPSESFDKKMDMIITEKEILR